jgi:two-component system response regulator AlgR
MKILIVDDEAPARERLRRMVGELDGCTVCGEASSGGEALLRAEQSRPDVLLLDIRMPGMDGLEAARHLAALDQPPAVIFTTAYGDYALKAFETHAVDYLLKPVRQARLGAALENARRLTRIQANTLQHLMGGSRARSQICARVRGSLQMIPVDDVRYFQADQKYVTVRHSQGQVLVEESLKSLEEEFGERFIRVHRNALVSARHLAGLARHAEGRHRIRLTDVEETLEVSRRHLPEVRKRLKRLS